MLATSSKQRFNMVQFAPTIYVDWIWFLASPSISLVLGSSLLGKVGMLQSMGSQGVRHDLATEQQLFTSLTTCKLHGH